MSLTNWLPKSAVSSEGRPYSGNKLVKWLEMVDAEVSFRGLMIGNLE